jgi:hypothetical protein
MKYTVQIDINLPLDHMITLFDNPANLKHWQPGFVSFEPISGTPGEVGAKSRLMYQMGKRDVELIETITKRDLPREFSGTYETQGMWNEIKNQFEAIDSQTTKWTSEVEFHASGFMMKAMTLLMPGMFKKRSMQHMELFKKWAESQEG